MKIVIRTILIGCCMLMAGTAVDFGYNSSIIIKEAQAVVGRPLTPRSVAGVARRTTRRVIVRTAVFVAVLPGGCSTVVIDGVTLHQCGSTYYQASGTQYVVVTVQ